jgi:methyl-branched lipid omega-hydroxylase
MNSATPRSLDDPAFWHRPLQERMDDIAAMRAHSPFVAGAAPNALTGSDDLYTAVISFAELTDISRRPLDFCSGQGSTSIVDMPASLSDPMGEVGC